MRSGEVTLVLVDLDAIGALMQAPDSAKRVYLALAAHPGEPSPTARILMGHTNLSLRSVRRGIAELRALGLLARDGTTLAPRAQDDDHASTDTHGGGASTGTQRRQDVPSPPSRPEPSTSVELMKAVAARATVEGLLQAGRGYDARAVWVGDLLASGLTPADLVQLHRAEHIELREHPGEPPADAVVIRHRRAVHTLARLA